MTRKITEFELIDHGVEHSQYFQGCGCAFTSFEHVVTGIGGTPDEAIDDCLESISQGEADTEGMEGRILTQEGWEEFPQTPIVGGECKTGCGEDEDCDGCEMYYYVSIRYNLEA